MRHSKPGLQQRGPQLVGAYLRRTAPSEERRLVGWALRSAPTASVASEAAPKANKGKGKSKPADDEVEVPLNELRAGRLEKVEAMRAAGVNPYAYTFAVTHSAAAFAEAFTGLGNARAVAVERA